MQLYESLADQLTDIIVKAVSTYGGVDILVLVLLNSFACFLFGHLTKLMMLNVGPFTIGCSLNCGFSMIGFMHP